MDTEDINPQNLRKLTLFIGFLLLFMVSYSVLYFGAGISLEREVVTLLRRTEKNPKANEIREQIYLQILESNAKISSSQYKEAVQELGQLRSTQAVQPLVNKLLSFPLRNEKIDTTSVKLALLIIEALSQIGSPEACEPLVQVEIASVNIQIKEKANKAADRICE